MRIHFTKMHGLGNDFVVLDATAPGAFIPTPAQVRFLADRFIGVGCDQLLIVEPATTPGVDFCYRIFNADGGEVEQCGNGARCFVRFVHEQGLSDKREIRVETQSGLITLRRETDGQVTVDMGVPRCSPADLPFESDLDAATVRHALEVNGETVDIAIVSMGNPHAVLVVDDVASAPVATLGPAIESHPSFPRRVNVGFMQIIDRHAIALRVYERGAGETQACGTGACAAVVAGIRLGLLESPVRVATRRGALHIAWDGTRENTATPVLMTGPAETVFTADIELPPHLS
jgi:diaminopimelate epimerase